MQPPTDPSHLNIYLGEKQVRTQHAYTWDQALEIHDLVFASAQEALDSNALIAFPIRKRTPTQGGREIINADNPSTLAASYESDNNTPVISILQLAAAAAVIAAGTGIGIAAVVAVIGLAWG